MSIYLETSQFLTLAAELAERKMDVLEHIEGIEKIHVVHDDGDSSYSSNAQYVFTREMSVVCEILNDNGIYQAGVEEIEYD